MAIWKGVISDIECLPITKMMNMWRLCVTSATHQAWNGSHSIAGSPQMTPMSEMSKMIILHGFTILNNHNAK